MKYIFIAFLLFSQFCFANYVSNSVVLISCTSQNWRFDQPWVKNPLSQGSGTGFVISGNRIITNAHVVSDAQYIEVKRISDDKKYTAKVRYIAHDCDLAMLDIEDSSFFESMTPLEFGGLPKIDSTVTTYGFPLGGSQLSVTRGVVSRIQQWTYSHSGSDAHLVIQTDAAINPGNSGGPVLQDDKVVGVAFQGLTKADNIGYLIPTLVVEHFLKDVEDGVYDGFGEIGINFRYDLQNPMVREILNVPEDLSGVLVTRVYPNMPAYGKLKEKDILLEIDDYAIMSDGYIMLDGREVEFPEVMERMQVGENLRFKVWREGKEIDVNLTLKKWDLIIPHMKPYDVVPNYYIRGGLCFTPLSNGYLMTVGGWKKAPLSVRLLYLEVYGDKELVKHKDYPVLCQILPHEVNQGSKSFKGLVVESVNKNKIKSMTELKKAFEESKLEYLTIKFWGDDLPLILSTHDLKKNHFDILKQYRIQKGERIQ